MRIHTVVALYVLFFSKFFSITKEGFVLLILTIALVITAEMFNTAIESLANFCSWEYNAVIRVTKDIAAGAVVCCAGFAVFIGFVLFFDVPQILDVIVHFLKNPVDLLLLTISIFVSVCYVFLGPVGIKRMFCKLIKGGK